MKKFIFLTGLLSVALGYCLFSCRPASSGPAPEKAIAQTLLKQVDSFVTLCGGLKTAVEGYSAPSGGGVGLSGSSGGSSPSAVSGASAGEKKLQQLFLQVRLAYKSFEWAAEYFDPATSRFVNGPPVPEVERFSQQVFEPAGLQVIEGALFPKYDTSQKQEIIKLLVRVQTSCKKYQSHFGNIDIFNWQVFDAVKLEVFRVVALGISGFDNPLTLKSMEESAASLRSLKEAMANYNGGDSLRGKFDAAIGYLGGHSDFNGFNRAEFITGYCNPLSVGLSDLEGALKIPVTRYNRLLDQDAKTLFDTNAFNSNAYAPDPSSFLSAEKIALGKVLFADPTLSGTGTRSCQSCHQPEKAFTDGLVKNTVIGNNALLKRNTPTLINAALQPSQFYDMRVNTLEDQSLSVVQSILEMHGSMSLSVAGLWKNERYRELFSKAFPKKDRSGIDTLEVMNAIGSYVRSLVLLNSRFDEYMRGNLSAMNADEVNGFNLFMGKAKCATCHYMPLFNGTFPPRYVKTESEVIGVPGDTLHHKIDGDVGRYDVFATPSFLHAFKIPTVRNIARTAPYMHNGVFTSLEQVMDFYNKGGGTGLGMKLDNQTLPFDKLDLTEKEKGDVIKFIKSLDSR